MRNEKLFSPPVKQAIILAGGLGTRLGALTKELPKPILPVGGEPFLCYVLWLLEKQGVRKVVLSTGYKADVIRSALEKISGIEICYAVEENPLGTGGGARLAADYLDDEPFFVLNGDTIFDAPLTKLAVLRQNTGGRAAMTLRYIEDTARYGAVQLNGSNVISMNEKTRQGEGLINGGIYLFEKDVLYSLLPDGASSIEKDLLPRLIENKALVGLPYRGFFIDIGVPETYNAAQATLPRWKNNRSRPFLLLDRDGTLIVEKNYLSDPEEVEVIPGVIKGLRALRDKGFRFVVLSNQAGVGRGYYKENDVYAVNNRMLELLSQQGITFDGVFFCPHHPDAGCLCRKPRPGMAYKAMDEIGFSLEKAAFIGDKACDIELGKSLGIPAILVRSGYGKEQEAALTDVADFIANDMEEAAQWLCYRFR